MKLKPLALVMAAFAAANVSPVSAQSADGFALEEVIVTARKREESLQETPVAVTALTTEALQQAGIRNLYDLNKSVPNIEVQSANGNAPLANIYIRGVGQRNSGPNIDSGVGIYIDDVYVGRPDGALLDVNDVASVQVLRGPQGTLFGKNTTGGALVFTTNRPTEEFGGSASLRVGNYERLDGSAVLNVPITDTFLSRLSATMVTRDGYVDNAYDGEKYMDEDRVGAILQFRWLATDDLTVDLNTNYGETDQKARPQKCQVVPGAVGWQSTLFNTLAVVPATGRTVNDFCLDAQNLGGELDVISDLGGLYKSENTGASLNIGWDVNDDMALKSVTAWRNTEAGQDDELDHMGIPFLHRTQFVHPFSTEHETDQFSQEFQLSGAAVDERLQYVSGLYYFQEKTDDMLPVSILGPFDPAVSPALIFLNSNGTLLETDNDAWAVFSQVEWAWTESWRTTLGVRYTDENRELDRELNGIDPATLDLNGGPVVPVGGGLYAVRRPTFELNPNWGYQSQGVTSASIGNDKLTGMGSVQYLLDESEHIDAGSIYFTISQGFMSGGLSEAPTGDLAPFDPEEVLNYELGFKLDLMDRRLRVNAALFYSDYKNRQLTTLVINPTTNSPAGATINAKESSIAGLELETTFLATENLQFTLNATFNDGEIEEFDDTQLLLGDAATPPAAGCSRSDLTIVLVDACPNDRSDENLPRLPEQSYYAAVQYNIATEVGVFVPRLQASYKTDIEYCFDSASCRSGYWLEDEQFDLSARLMWISTDEKWNAALFGSNLTDEAYVVGGTALVEATGVGGYAYSAPRMYGAEVTYSF